MLKKIHILYTMLETRLEKRIEEKVKLPLSYKNNLLKNLFDLNFKYLHPERVISSIYYDNNRFQIYQDSAEGIVPRKKIRIRESFGELHLEHKFKNQNGKYKKHQKVNNIPNKIIDNIYGVTFPVCKIEYKRLYLTNNKIRITVDSNLKYQNYKNSISNYNVSFFITEFKMHNDLEISKNFIDSKINFSTIKFSKYDDAIKKLHLL
jgi:hypothetical protein